MRKLILKEDGTILGKFYKKGHIFEVVDEDGLRGLDLKDEDGKILYETRMISNLFDDLKN